MQLLALSALSPLEIIPAQGMVCHDVRNPRQRTEVLVRKGTLLGAAEVAALLGSGVSELHLAVPEPGDVGEDDAATPPWRHRRPTSRLISSSTPSTATAAPPTATSFSVRSRPPSSITCALACSS